jgi:sorbose reductase
LPSALGDVSKLKGTLSVIVLYCHNTNRELISQYKVTGGAGYLGLDACRALLEHGASGITIFDIPSSFETASIGIRALQNDFPEANIFSRTIDVTDPEAVSQGVKEAAKLHGSIEMMLCFAGIVLRKNATDIDIDAWNRIMNINVTGSWLCAQAAAK